MAEARREHVRAMWRRLEPRADDVAGADLPPHAGEQVLSEPRVAIARCVNGGCQIRAARRVRELSAGRDALALQRGSACQGRALLQPTTTILNARPVDETADRPRLDCGCRGGIGRCLARTGRGQIGAPPAAGAVGLSHDKERREGREDRCHEDKADRGCRRRRSHGSHRAPKSIRILALIG